MASSKYLLARSISCLCCITLCAYLSGGCGGDVDNGNDNDTSTSECETTTADALVSVDDNDATELAATAVTGDCANVAVYEDDGVVSQLAVEGDSGESVIEFNDDGQPVAVRDSEGNTTSFSFNALGFTRSEGESGASVFATPRETETNARAISQDTGEAVDLDFCEEVKFFADVINAGCDADGTQPYCSGSVTEAVAAALALCEDGRTIEEVGGLDGIPFGEIQEDFELGVDGFVTARPAAGGGTTFICAAEAFGGVPRIDIEWEVIEIPEGASAPLSQLPGGSAVVDGTTSTGVYVFEVTATDDAGSVASDTITFELGNEDDFFGLRIIASSCDVEANEVIELSAVLQGVDDMDGTDDDNAQEDPTADDLSQVFWDFGNGDTLLTAADESFEYSYDQEGEYYISAVWIAGAECDFIGDKFVVVGGDGVFQEPGGLDVEVTAAPAVADAGGTVDVEATATGGNGEIVFAMGIVHVDPPGAATIVSSDGLDVAQAPDPGEDEFFDFVFIPGNNATVECAPGQDVFFVVAADAVDAAGNAGTGFTPGACCDNGVFGEIKPPFEIPLVGESIELEAVAISCTGDAVSCEWSAGDGGTAVTIDDRNACRTSATASEPGSYQFNVVMTDANNNRSDASILVQVLPEGSEGIFAVIEGPPNHPLFVPSPISSFIQGGAPPYFCYWDVLSDDNDEETAFFPDPFECGITDIQFLAPGCVDIQLLVDDFDFNTADSEIFTVCGGDEFDSCPLDDFCDPECPTFDFDCDDPCPLDGDCNEDCIFQDPDCFDDADFCAPGDFICDDFCKDFGPPDPDCDSCEEDGICVDFCPQGVDPDCFRDFCVSGDGICDFGCFPEDTDCEDFCQPDDGFCDFPCETPDPDCGSNDDLCIGFGYCCDGDGFCDIGECPEDDGDCDECGEDGRCIEGCDIIDPDCEGEDCVINGFCEPEFGEDPETCPADCGAGFCGDFFCDPQSGEDEFSCSIDCGAGGGFCGDFFCDPQIGEDEVSCSADCGGAGGFCGDGFCDPEIGEDDLTCSVDCAIGGGFCGDGVCDPQLGEDSVSCQNDCGSGGGFCGDAICDVQLGEDRVTCPVDCDDDGFCGDGICDSDENSGTCPVDCGSGGFCGDAVCDSQLGEDSVTCPTDCGGSGSCGDGICDSQLGEDSVTCPVDCGSSGFCGDGVCDILLGEDRVTCPSDCDDGGTCVDGDLICDLECPNPPYDSDCTNSEICAFNGFCCDGDQICDSGCPTTDTDCL